MAIYVDEIQDHRVGRRTWKTCHMMTDGNIDELHKMAEKLGIRRYFQEHDTHPHYDLFPSKREAAIKLGAVSVSGREMVIRCSKVFEGVRIEGSAEINITKWQHEYEKKHEEERV